MRLKTGFYNIFFQVSLLIILVLVIATGCHSIPNARPGKEAEKLANRMFEAVNLQAWNKNTASVSWVFMEKHSFFWDKNRGYVQVAWDDYKVQYNKKNFRGIAFEKDVLINDPQKNKELIRQANEYFVNDAFWLNPLFHIQSPGTELKWVQEGQLLVHFTSGGVTPGDTYLFFIDNNGLVKKMQMWVSAIPIKGVSAEFSNYITTATGVRCATNYEFLIDIQISNIRMYSKYPENQTNDIFQKLSHDF